jgi:hypothetical protein
MYWLKWYNRLACVIACQCGITYTGKMTAFKAVDCLNRTGNGCQFNHFIYYTYKTLFLTKFKSIVHKGKRRKKSIRNFNKMQLENNEFLNIF